jgi:hypothetical protein
VRNLNGGSPEGIRRPLAANTCHLLREISWDKAAGGK